jgi:hypothetical protein
MKHVLALIYVESPSRYLTCRDYLERRATHYTARPDFLLPAYVAYLIRLSK